MNAGRTARDRARVELTNEIKEAARQRLAAEGAHRLSLRAVARDLGMVSSALYRYFASRDELLTALIIDAYDALGSAVEHADQAADPPDARGRWRSACTAVRTWALAHPHEYALIYGSPVPGYRAPETTIAPASRVPLVLAGIVRDAWSAGALDPGAMPEAPPLPSVLTGQLEAVGSAIAPGVPPVIMDRCLIAWTQLFGMVSFELFGQLVGSVDPSDAFFAHTVEHMSGFLGLTTAAG